MAAARWWLALAASGWAAVATADARGAGSRAPAWTPPSTKSAGPTVEAPTLRSPGADFERALGMFGGLGAGKDSLGPWRLGRFGGRSASPSYGEAAGQGSGSETWRSGDLVRSTSAADVRSARQQQAPDLEWPGSPHLGEETYGKQFQRAQERPKR